MSSGSEISRRNSLKNAVAGGAGLSAMSGMSFISNPARVFGANDRVRIAVVGLRSQGFTHIEGFSRELNAEIAAVCDVDETS